MIIVFTHMVVLGEREQNWPETLKLFGSSAPDVALNSLVCKSM